MSTETSELHITEIPREDKCRWAAAACASNQKLAEWAVNALNNAVPETNPEWAFGLSERARLCLLSAGFDSRESVAKAVADGFDIAAISNAGTKIKDEVESWIK